MGHAKMDFDEWWMRTGRWLDPEPSVSWHDKRKSIMEAAWAAAKAQSGNYVCDKEVEPEVVTFANGRRVKFVGDYGSLEIGWSDE